MAPAILFLLLPLLFLLVSCYPHRSFVRDTGKATDQDYIARFHQRFSRIADPERSEDYAGVPRYDRLYMGSFAKRNLERIVSGANEDGWLAWGLSYHMMSLNQMFRVTGDSKYLWMNMSYILSVDTVRDDRRGVRLWTGATAPAWGSVGYAERGRSVFAVQTGMITFPILDFLSLIGESGRPDLVPVEVASGLRDMALEALSFHDPQWKDGPLEDEGHYVGRDQEERFEDKPLPANRQSAMGRAQWAAYRVTGDQDYRRRAVAIGRYLKRRLFVARDGAYYWNYVLPREPIRGVFPRERIKGEDISHGALSASLPLLLHSEGEVFTELDMVRIGRTVTRGFGRLGDGVLFGDITGSPVSDPSYVSVVTRWIGFSRFVPDVRRLIWEFYRSYVRQPDPYELAMLITYADPQHSTGMRLAVGAGVDDAVRILYCSGKPDRVTNCDGQRLARQTGREEE